MSRLPKSPLLARASRRHLFTHPWQLALAVLGVALGVAVFVSIDLATGSARRALALSLGAVQGRATHEIVAAAQEGLDERLFVRLVQAGIRPAAPVIEGTVRGAPSRDQPKGAVLRLLGVDPFSEGPFRPAVAFGSARSRDLDLRRFLIQPGACVLSHATAARLHASPGSAFPVLSGGRPRTIALAGVLDPKSASASEALDDLLICDVSTAQEILGRLGRLSRIDLALPEGEPGRRALARIASLLPAGATLQDSAGRLREGDEMTRAFRLNLSALSLLALVCGAFLIYNTMTFSVVQRRRLIGLLRALGATRGEIFRLVLGEAAAVGAVGTILGLAAGVGLGRGLVGLVAGTINDLYFALSVRRLDLSPRIFAAGAAVGLGATLFAALAPALEATRTPPRAAMVRSLLEARARRALPRASALGALLVLSGAALLSWPNLPASFLALFLTIVGCALLAPGAALLLARAARPLFSRALGRVGRMAAGGLEAGLSRTGVAIAALVVAVSVTVGVGAMIGSFRGSVDRWLDRSLRADLYASPAEREPGWAGASRAASVARDVARLPGVSRVRPLRRAEVASPRGAIRLIAATSDPAGVVLERGDPASAWQALARGEVFASEPLASRLGLDVGSILPLATARGVRPFRVAAVYQDYASDRGIARIDLDVYRRLWGDDRISGLGIDLSPGADAGATARAVRALDPDAPWNVVTNRELKRRSLAVFDRTFRITAVLRWLAGLVAFLGVLSALLALQLERTREIGVLRALGMTPGQVAGLVAAETGLLGLAAGLLALPVGLALAWILIEVIDRRSFGWSMDLALSGGTIAGAVALALGAALCAGIVPALRMARTSPGEALREE
ncbi:MAG TPA: FtsX-like permease family protein [Thermoanaerobaculia bacterium]|nr:FtsX-like permease family protein [Thermoanaerobaculia bacterium]